MTQEQTIKFKEIIEELSEEYSSRNIELRKEYGNEYVYMDGICRLCLTGYVFLYNLKRLCEALNDELN